MKQIVKKLLPPIILDLLRSKPMVTWQGIYQHWNEVLQKTSTYATDDILGTVTAATQKVLSGEYPYERDGVVFNKAQHNFPLLTCFGYIFKELQRPLSVVDFGGSLGSVYISNRWFFDKNAITKWIVVEQPNFVECGRQIIENKNLPLSFANPTSYIISGKKEVGWEGFLFQRNS